MQPHLKLKTMRLLKGWSQEELAEKLNLSLRGYAKIEQGNSDISLTRLQQIADSLEVTLDQLLGLNENNIYHIAEHCTAGNNVNNNGTQNIYLTETQAAHQLEKAQILLKERDKEIQHQQEIIKLLKEQLKSQDNKD